MGQKRRSKHASCRACDPDSAATVEYKHGVAGNIATLTNAPVPNDSSGRSFLLINGLFGTLNSAFQDIAVIQGHNNVIYGNVLGAAGHQPVPAARP